MHSLPAHTLAVPPIVTVLFFRYMDAPLNLMNHKGRDQIRTRGPDRLGVRFSRPLWVLLWRNLGYVLGPGAKLANSLSIASHRTHGIPITEGAIATRRLPSSLEADRTNLPGGDSVAGQ